MDIHFNPAMTWGEQKVPGFWPIPIFVPWKLPQIVLWDTQEIARSRPRRSSFTAAMLPASSEVLQRGAGMGRWHGFSEWLHQFTSYYSYIVLYSFTIIRTNNYLRNYDPKMICMVVPSCYPKSCRRVVSKRLKQRQKWYGLSCSPLKPSPPWHSMRGQELFWWDESSGEATNRGFRQVMGVPPVLIHL